MIINRGAFTIQPGGKNDLITASGNFFNNLIKYFVNIGQLGFREKGILVVENIVP